MNYKLVNSCRICKSKRLKKYLDLGSVPLANSLLRDSDESPAKYPVQVLFCEDCSLSQLSIVVDPTIMFTDYLYHSSVSKTFQKHCRDMALELKKFATKNSPPSLIDIAANDGCLMEQFRHEGFVVRGFDPCERMARDAWKDKLLLIIPKFWNKETAICGRSWSGEDFITATNVLAHVDDLYGFLEGVKYHFEYNPKGVFVAEFPYFHNLLENNQFDTIYHEHLSYFLFRPIVKLFRECGIPIFKVEQYDIHGGSLRIYASMYPYREDKSILDTLILERELELDMFHTYENFASRVENVKESLRTTLELLSRNGEKVMCYGASAKGISLLNYCNIPKEFIHSIVDDTPEKQGKWTPGTRIPIVDFSHFEKERPQHILLTAWNFSSELIEKTKSHRARNGTYILPIPEVRIV